MRFQDFFTWVSFFLDNNVNFTSSQVFYTKYILSMSPLKVMVVKTMSGRKMLTTMKRAGKNCMNIVKASTVAKDMME